ncbi:MAG: hypothetical protein R3C28_33385 [Pirellulaceae bacterium]
MEAVEKLGRTIYANNDTDLATFLYETGRTGTKNQEDLLQESLRLLKGDKSQTLLQVDIWTRLGLLVMLNPDLAEKRFRTAIELAESLDDSQRALVSDLPERGLATILNDQDLIDEALIQAKSAIELARRLKHDEELVLLLCDLSNIYWNLLDEERAIETADEAVKIASTNGEVENQLKAWNHRLELEQRRPRYNMSLQRELVTRAMSFVKENWPVLHRNHGGPLAQVLGTSRAFLWTAGATDEADKITQRSALLSAYLQASVDRNTAWNLRWHGDIERSIEYYDRANRTIQKGGGYWGFISCGRAYESVRDFESQLKQLQKAVEIGNDDVEPWTSMSLDFAIASTLRRLGKNDEARKVFEELAIEMRNHSLRLWGEATASAYLFWVEMSEAQDKFVDESSGSFYDQALQQLDDDMPVWPTGRVYTHAVLGMIAERKGDLNMATERFIKANGERPGTFAQIHTEWVTDHLVELLVNANRLDECERILRDDITRRDAQVTPIHPERAFVRLRLVQFLVDHKRDTTGAAAWLAEAKKIYEYHANVLPQAEIDKLSELEQAVASTER